MEIGEIPKESSRAAASMVFLALGPRYGLPYDTHNKASVSSIS